MLRFSIVAGAVLAVSAPALARPQAQFPLAVADDASLEWTAPTTLGPLVSADTSAALRGALRVELASTPAGPLVGIDGRIRLESFGGAVLDANGDELARAALVGVVLRLEGAAAPATAAPGGGLAFDVDASATYASGSLALDPPFGPSSLVDLTGGAADDLRLRGRLVRDGDAWRLVAPLRLQLGFGDPNGFGGVFRLQGPLRARTPCVPARLFCAQGPGAPGLAPLGASAGGELRFLVREAPADRLVALFGGQAQAPAPAAAGDLCVGAPRALLATGTTGPGGAVVLAWEPGPGAALALANGGFAVQARVAGGASGAELTNAIRLRDCGE